MDYKITVIMPIYNAEKNLKNTIESIINQSFGFENIELILIDDSSTDNSKNIIQSYSKKYKNVIPFYSNKNHGSPGFGRNIGLKLSTSEFIMFIDNDDEYEKDICKKLYDAINNENADIACCNKISVDNISNIKQYIHYKKGTEKNNIVIIQNDDILFFDSVAVWNKIYKKEIIIQNKLKFLEDTRADDFAFTIDYYINSEKLVFLKDYHGYFWNIKSDSLSHVVTEKHIDELLKAYLYIFYQLKNKNKEKNMSELIKSHITYLIIQCSYFDLKNKEIKTILKKICDFEKEINFNIDLDETWANKINQLILKENYGKTILLLKIIQKLRNSTLLRKINRKL